MRLLLVNSNTSVEVTARVEAVARQAASPGTEIRALTAPFGARYITTRAELTIAGHATLAALAEHGAGADAAVVACFGDPGLAAARELLPIPVVGMAESAIVTACMLGGKFSIVTGGHRWVPMLHELVAALGLSGRLASVRTLALSAGEIGGDQAAAEALAGLAQRAAGEDGAEAVILGGAGIAGMASLIAPRVPVPLLDPTVTSVLQAEVLVRLGAAKPR
ncbi:MAG: aspartate/glutamate racemase family protein [Pseudomonadota bacterium]